jgi:hypothetical protein
MNPKILSDANASRADSRLAYSLAAGAAMVAGTSAADGAVVYSGLRDIAIDQHTSQSIDLDNDTHQDITLKNYVFANGNYQGATVNFAPGRLVGFKLGSLYYTAALSAGATIDATSLGPNFLGSMAYGALNPNAQFNNVTNAYIGFSFPLGPVNTYNAWVRVDVNNAAGTFIIHDWAYENTPGTGIIAGYRGVPGDYNHDGVVDSSDFDSWQSVFGQPTPPGSDADGNANGVVDTADYTVWRDHLSQTQPASGAAPSAAIPEPSTLGLLAAGSGGVYLMRRLRRT